MNWCIFLILIFVVDCLSMVSLLLYLYPNFGCHDFRIRCDISQVGLDCTLWALGSFEGQFPGFYVGG